MADEFGNKLATGGRGLKIVPCKIRGKDKWRLDARVNGKGPRPTFDAKADAEKALADAKKQQAAFGKAFDILPAKDKARLMAVVQEIRLAGFSMDDALAAVKKTPVTPKAVWTLQVTKDKTLEAKRAQNRREDYIKGLDQYLTAFIRGRENLPITAMGVSEINQWFAAREEAPSTRNSNLGRIASMMKVAWAERQIPENPCHRISSITVDKKTPITLTPRQAMKALLWSYRREPMFLAWLTLASKIGLRPEAEADFVDWSMINLKTGRLKIDTSKVRNVPHRIIYLKDCPGALEWLKVAKRVGSKLPLKPVTRRRYLRKLRDYLGLKAWPQDVLRHTAATVLLEYHKNDLKTVSRILANSPRVLLGNYVGVMDRKEAMKFLKVLPKKRHLSKKVDNIYLS